MSFTWLTSLARKIFCTYLRRFPVRDGKEFLYQRLQKRLAPRAGRVPARLIRGFTLALDLDDPVQRRMFFFGDYDERREADLISRVLTPGEVFWDVGANLGYFTLLAASTLKHTGQVVALEPSPGAYACLMENISRNPFTNIQTFRLAATDREGEAVLYSVPGQPDGRANLFRPGPGQTGSTPVDTVTLDAWRQRQHLPGPDFIKLDVEGAELAALTGARKTLNGLGPAPFGGNEGGHFPVPGHGPEGHRRLSQPVRLPAGRPLPGPLAPVPGRLRGGQPQCPMA